MQRKEEFEAVEKLLQDISKEDLVRLLLNRISTDRKNSIPVSVFNTELSPLEAVTRYMKEQGRGTNEIARLLNKKPPSISEAHKKAKSKSFVVKDTDVLIPLSEFTDNPSLSVLEIVVSFLRGAEMRFTQIAELMGKDPKTVWTCHSRAQKKLGER